MRTALTASTPPLPSSSSRLRFAFSTSAAIVSAAARFCDQGMRGSSLCAALTY